jgi:hypothetical protein
MFHDCVGIRKTLTRKAASQMRDGRVGDHHEVPSLTPTMQRVERGGDEGVLDFGMGGGRPMIQEGPSKYH